jgi:hypothetical protein
MVVLVEAVIVDAVEMEVEDAPMTRHFTNRE